MHLLSLLKEADPARHLRAVRGLRDSSITITYSHKTKTELRGYVRNGTGVEYEVEITDGRVSCSCPDATHRKGPCKHAIALAVSILQQTETADNRIHLMWDNGHILCGATDIKRFWQRWNYNALSWPDVCPQCVHQWTHSAEEVRHGNG